MTAGDDEVVIFRAVAAVLKSVDKPVRKNHIRYGLAVITKGYFGFRQVFAQFFYKNARYRHVPDAAFDVYQHAQDVRFGLPVRIKQLLKGRFKMFTALRKRHGPAHGCAIMRGGADGFPGAQSGQLKRRKVFYHRTCP